MKALISQLNNCSYYRVFHRRNVITLDNIHGPVSDWIQVIISKHLIQVRYRVTSRCQQRAMVSTGRSGACARMLVRRSNWVNLPSLE